MVLALAGAVGGTEPDEEIERESRLNPGGKCLHLLLGCDLFLGQQQVP